MNRAEFWVCVALSGAIGLTLGYYGPKVLDAMPNDAPYFVGGK